MYRIVKRAGDITVAAVGLLVLSPLLVTIGLLVKLGSPGPMLFKQKRIGRGGHTFTMFKFRTMNIDAPSEVPTHEFAAPEQHITRLGSLLRRSSCDELPQLLNILVGDMAVVGPRPALWNQLDLISERERYGANDVRPGLTGWAQVNGRDEIPIEQKARLDGEYVVAMGPWLDAKCVLLTIARVLRREGIVEGARNEVGKPVNDGHEARL